MADHGSVQAVLGHDATLAPGLLRLTPLGSSVLKPNLQEIEKIYIARFGCIQEDKKFGDKPFRRQMKFDLKTKANNIGLLRG